jgi:methyl-accepting chemotaxis protein
VQNVSNESVEAIRAIGHIIDQNSEVAKLISEAIHQQTSATQEISSNVQQVSSGTCEVSTSISNVTTVAEQSHVAANEVLQDSGKLLHQAGRLREEIKTFLSKVRG